MAVSQSDRRKLTVALKKLGVPDVVAQNYLSSLDTGPKSTLKSAQHAIVLALIKKFPRKYGWANEKEVAKDAVLVEARTGQMISGHPPVAGAIKRGGLLTTPTVPIVSIGRLKVEIEFEEGRVPHMYLDKEGHVTVGVGHLLDTVDKALTIPFVLSADVPRPSVVGQTPDTPPRQATDAEIERDYQVVKALPKGQAAHFYAPATRVELTETTIESLFEEDIEIHRDVANNYFPLNQLPRAAQFALVDLAFQRGGPGLVREFVKLLDHLKRRDFKAAGSEVSVQGGGKRNQRRKALMEQAARSEPFFIKEKQLQKKLKLLKVLLRI